jgi:hypothetical protein
MNFTSGSLTRVQNRVVAAIIFMKADESTIALSHVEMLKNIYSDGLPWIEQQHGSKLVRADHRVYLEQNLSSVLVYSSEFRRSAHSR